MCACWRKSERRSAAAVACPITDTPVIVSLKVRTPRMTTAIGKTGCGHASIFADQGCYSDSRDPGPKTRMLEGVCFWGS